jgi:hypothetical protein
MFASIQVDLGVVEGLRSVSAYFLYAISMAVVVKLQGQWLITLGAENIVILPVQIITGALFYISLLLLFNRNAVLRLIGELRSKKLA